MISFSFFAKVLVQLKPLFVFLLQDVQVLIKLFLCEKSVLDWVLEFVVDDVIRFCIVLQQPFIKNTTKYVKLGLTRSLWIKGLIGNMVLRHENIQVGNVMATNWALLWG